MLRNQFSGGAFVRQGKRLAFNVGASPAFFGFFPGFGPLARIRHTVTPIISYQYAPGVKIPDDYARAFDPTGRTLKGRTDPQQTISLGLAQTFEAKLKPAAGDTTEKEPRKIKLLSISTSAISYNFERAKLPHNTGWQTGTLSNTFLSDLVPGFQLSMTHDLWKERRRRMDTAKFSPFLQSVNASFQSLPRRLQGIAACSGSDQRAGLPRRHDRTRRQRPQRPHQRLPAAIKAPHRLVCPAGLWALWGRRGWRPAVCAGRDPIQHAQPRGHRGVETPCRATDGRAESVVQSHTKLDRELVDVLRHRHAAIRRSLAAIPARPAPLARELRLFTRPRPAIFSFIFNITLTDQPDIKFDYDQRNLRPVDCAVLSR